MPRLPRRIHLMAITAGVLVLAGSSPAAAQADTSIVTRRGWTLRKTMEVFANGYPWELFPRRGTWTWVVAREQADGSDRVGRWRFTAAQLDSAAVPGGPLCDSFAAGESVTHGSLAMVQLNSDDRPWRRAGGTRFVPPFSTARSPVFVRWRREDDRWVVDEIGERRLYIPHLVGRLVDEVERDARPTPLSLPLPPETPVAANAEWFTANRPIRVQGRGFVKYGLPRPLTEADVVRYGRIHGVPVYAEPGTVGRFPQVVYVPTDRAGSFHPYQNMSGNGCEH